MTFYATMDENWTNPDNFWWGKKLQHIKELGSKWICYLCVEITVHLSPTVTQTSSLNISLSSKQLTGVGVHCSRSNSVHNEVMLLEAHKFIPRSSTWTSPEQTRNSYNMYTYSTLHRKISFSADVFFFPLYVNHSYIKKVNFQYKMLQWIIVTDKCLGGECGVIFSLLWSTAFVQKTDRQLHVFFKVHVTQQTKYSQKHY